MSGTVTGPPPSDTIELYKEIDITYPSTGVSTKKQVASSYSDQITTDTTLISGDDVYFFVNCFELKSGG